MFTSIELKGYGPFRDVRLDLLGRNDRPMNRALIYGENGSGKTVLAESVGFLKRSVGTLSGSRTVLDDSNPFQFGTILIDKVVSHTEFYSIQGFRLLSEPTDGIYIARIIYTDGSTAVIKRVARR